MQMYLIRRENRVFLGPMTAEEFRDGLRKMSFGLQDEVAGHCGKWVILDHEEQIRKNYPELVSIITSELPVSWREMTGHAKQMTKKDQKVKGKSAQRPSHAGKSSRDLEQYARRRKNRNNGILFGSILVAAVAIGAALYLKTHDESLPAVGEMSALAQKSDPTEFLNEMGLRLVPIVNKINRGKDPQQTWLPYLRMYAFYTNGAIENVSTKLLRGAIPAGAPSDCSVDSWKKRWKEGATQTSQWVNGKAMIRNQWTKMLAWDPYWIKRRSAKGWLKPRNWFEGCLMSATVAIRSVASDSNLGADPGAMSADVVAAVGRRLQAQIELIQIGKTALPQDLLTTPGVLTCFDQAESLAALQACRVKAADPQMQQLMDDHGNWQLARLALNANGAVDLPLQGELTVALPKMTNEEFVSKLDNAPELRFIQQIQQAGWKTDGVVERISGEFADVRLKP